MVLTFSPNVFSDVENSERALLPMRRNLGKYKNFLSWGFFHEILSPVDFFQNLLFREKTV